MDFDCVAPESWDDGMFERFRWLRENAPVYRDETNQIWVLTKHADVVHVSKHPEIFSSAEGGVRPIPTGAALSIIDMDEPRHGQLRRLINRGFTPRMVGLLEKQFRELTTRAIDAVVGRGECDFVRDIAVPLPLQLIARMIGIDDERTPELHRWSDDMMAGGSGAQDPGVMQRAGAASMAYLSYLQEIFADRAADPRDDLVSILVQARETGTLGDDGMGGDELNMFMILLMVAGNETTRNALSGGITALLDQPAELERLRADPALLQTAADEIVRFVSPVLNFARTATRDTELRGQPIAKGEKVLLAYPSANHDPDAFDEPDRLDVGRSPNPHVGFGIGPHFCLGANLARMEIRVVLDEVMRRLPDLAADGPPEIRPHGLVRTITRLPLRFTPSA